MYVYRDTLSLKQVYYTGDYGRIIRTYVTIMGIRNLYSAGFPKTSNNNLKPVANNNLKPAVFIADFPKHESFSCGILKLITHNNIAIHITPGK